MTYALHQLAGDDVALLRRMNVMFADAFAEPETYAEPPSDAYLEDLLTGRETIFLAALSGDEVVGGLVAYDLRKPERARSEVYIYDLAVAEPHRRRGVATALIGRLCEIGRSRGAWVVFVQADYIDPPAIALYEKLGVREEVLHFDIRL